LNFQSFIQSPKREFVIAGIFIVAGLLLFAPSVSIAFLSDDYYALIVFQQKGLKLFYNLHDRTFIPFTLFLMGVIHQIFGASAAAFRIFSIILHALNAYLIYRLLMRIFMIKGIHSKQIFLTAFLGGMFFLAFPFHAEPIVWIAATAYPLCVLLCLAAVHCYISYRTIGKNFLLIISVIAFFLALLSKEFAVVLPLIIAMFELFLFRGNIEYKIRFRKMSFSIILFIGVLLLYLLFRRLAAGEWIGLYGSVVHTQINAEILAKTLAAYFANFVLLFRYWQLVPGSFINNHTSLLLIGGAVITITGLIILLIRSRNTAKHSSLYLLLMSAFIALVPVLNLETGFLTQIQSERYGYFSAVFFCPAIAVLLTLIFKNKFWRVIFSVLILGLYILLLQMNIHKFRNAGALADKVLCGAATLEQTNEHTVLLNVPDTYDGVYVFRNGLAEALQLQHGDAGKRISALTYFSGNADAERITIMKNSDRISIRSSQKNVHVFADTDVFPSRYTSLLRSDNDVVILKMKDTISCRYYRYTATGDLFEIL